MKKLGILICLCMLISLLCGNALAVEAVGCYSITQVHDGDCFAIDEDALIKINFSFANQSDDEAYYSPWNDYTLQVNDGAEISGEICNFQGMYLVTLYYDAYLFVYGRGDNDTDLYVIYHIAWNYYNDYYDFDYKLYPVGDIECHSSPEQIRINLDESLTVLGSSNILSSPTYSEAKITFFEHEDYRELLAYARNLREAYGETDEAADETYTEDDTVERLHGIYWLPYEVRPLTDAAVACATEEFSLYADPAEGAEIGCTIQPGTLVVVLGYCDDWAYISKYEEDYFEICSGWLPMDPESYGSCIMINGESCTADDYLYGLNHGG